MNLTKLIKTVSWWVSNTYVIGSCVPSFFAINTFGWFLSLRDQLVSERVWYFIYEYRTYRCNLYTVQFLVDIVLSEEFVSLTINFLTLKLKQFNECNLFSYLFLYTLFYFIWNVLFLFHTTFSCVISNIINASIRMEHL